MQRSLLRAARRYFSSSDASKFAHLAQVSATNGVRSGGVSTSSREYNRFAWRGSSACRLAQQDIVSALRRGDRERASIMLLNLEHSNGDLNAEDFSLILEYCAEAPDPLFVMETWNFMKEEGINLNKRSYDSIIAALGRGGYWREALDLLIFLGEDETPHNDLPIYNIFLGACGSTGNLDGAERCLENMESHLLGKSEATYCELLKLAVLQRNLSAVHDIWKDCTRYYSPSIIALRKFVRSFTSLGDLRSAYNVLQHMVALAGQSTNNLRVSSRGRYQSSRLDIPVPAVKELVDLKFSLDSGLPSSFEGKLETREYWELFQEGVAVTKNPEFDSGKTRKALQSVPAAVRNFLRWSFNDIMHTCARYNNCQLAEQLFLEMRDIGLRPSRFTYDCFLKSVIAAKGTMHAIKVMEAMEKRGIIPYNDTLAALSVGHSKNLHLDLAEDLLERISDMRPKYIHAFNALLTGCDIMNEQERGLRILAKIKRLKIKPNVMTYQVLFSLFGKVNIPYEEGNMLSGVDVSKRISIIEMDMLKNGIHHNFVSMYNVIRALGVEGVIKEMLRFFNVAESVLWNMDPYEKSDLYNIVLHALVKAGEKHKAIKFFKIMRSSGVPANVAIYNIMIECCKLLPCFKSACALLSLIIRDGFCPTIVTYSSLVKVALANEDFEGASDLLGIMGVEGVQLDIEFFNTILADAYVKGHIHVIEHIVEHIHRAKIQPDPATASFLLGAYVRYGFDDAALEALQVISMRMISEDTSILQEERAHLEDLVISEESDTEQRIMKIFEADEYLAVALLNLRWCAMLGSMISWLPEQSLWARYLASSYDTSRRPHLS